MIVSQGDGLEIWPIQPRQRQWNIVQSVVDEIINMTVCHHAVYTLSTQKMRTKDVCCNAELSSQQQPPIGNESPSEEVTDKVMF